MQQSKSFSSKFDSLRLLFIVTMLICAGCDQGNTATVTGTITLDNILLDHGSVTFIAGTDNLGKVASGGIQPDGTYRVQMGQSQQLQAGEYVVKVTSYEPSIPDPDGGPPLPGSLITPERYADARTSGLRFFVRPGENVIDIPLVIGNSPAFSVEPSTTDEDAEEQDVANGTDEGTEEKLDPDVDTTINEPSVESAEVPGK